MPIKSVVIGLIAVSSLAGCMAAVAQKSQLSPDDNASALACPKESPEPFTGALMVESKYVQSDRSKTTLKESRSDQSEQIQRHIGEFTKRIVYFTDFYLQNPDSRKGLMARACVEEWISAWASAGALTTDETSKTGVAVRKWTLASLSSALLKLKHVEGSRWTLTDEQQHWLEALADKVIADYAKRRDPDFSYFNNHDYWAAWGVAATGAVLGRKDYLNWGIPSYQRAMGQIETFADHRYGYLPNETARKQLAANYTHYALVPLVMLSDLLIESGYVPSEDEQRRLTQLVNFAAQMILQPSAVSAVLDGQQQQVPPYKLAWLIPYLSRYPDNALASQLYQRHNGQVDGYSQAGGLLRPLYGDAPAQGELP